MAACRLHSASTLILYQEGRCPSRKQRRRRGDGGMGQRRGASGGRREGWRRGEKRTGRRGERRSGRRGERRSGRRERGGVGGGREVFKRLSISPSSPFFVTLPLRVEQQASTPPLLSMSNPTKTENVSTLETAMQLMIQTFHKYSGDEGDKYTLSRAELKVMLSAELGNYLGNAQDKEAVDKVMGDLDANNDGEVDFTEFVILVGALTVACNDFFLEYNDKGEKK
uniref:S100 calcium binding protein T n=6 Tax=Salmoninae TaxID=504568 RepID=A0A4W5REG9_9TELE